MPYRKLSTLPLNGLKIVDITRVLAGPYATMNMGDLGADVVKIERLHVGDETRQWGPPYITPSLSTYFTCCNRNKRSIAIDYSKQEGQTILKKLVAQSDVFVENLKPGSLKKFGLDYATLSKLNDGLIYASLTGYGQNGPYSKSSAYDLTIAAEGGLIGITGPENGDPVKVGVAITDVCTGLYLFSAVLAALYQRTQTGKGQEIDVSMFSTQLSVLVNVASNYLNSGMIAKPRGTSHPSIVPYQGFKTSDGYVIVAANNDLQFRDLADAVGWPWLSSNPMFATNELRVENRVELLEHLEDRFTEESTQYWVELAEEYSFAVSVVNDIEAAFKHPQAVFSDIVKTSHHVSENVEVRFVGHPVKYNNRDTELYTAPPLLGQHTSDVMQELGYSEEEIKSLEKNNVIQTRIC